MQSDFQKNGKDREIMPSAFCFNNIFEIEFEFN